MNIAEFLEKVRELRKALIRFDNSSDEYDLPECLPCLDSFIKKLYIIEGWLLCMQKPGRI